MQCNGPMRREVIMTRDESPHARALPLESERCSPALRGDASRDALRGERPRGVPRGETPLPSRGLAAGGRVGRYLPFDVVKGEGGRYSSLRATSSLLTSRAGCGRARRGAASRAAATRRATEGHCRRRCARRRRRRRRSQRPYRNGRASTAGYVEWNGIQWKRNRIEWDGMEWNVRSGVDGRLCDNGTHAQGRQTLRKIVGGTYAVGGRAGV